MKKFTLFFALTIIMASCSQRPNDKGEYVVKPGKQSKEIHIKYNADGNIEYIRQYKDGNPEGLHLKFYDNQNPDNMTFSQEGKNNGTGLVFYKNGLLNNFGQYVDGEKTGWFYVFDKNSVLTGKKEFVLLEGKSYMNQWIEYDKNGIPNRTNSSYLTLSAFKDTIKTGEEYRLNVILEASYFKQYMLLIVGPFDENYSLPQNSTCDTIKSVNYTALYKTTTYKNGKNVIRGMVQEIKLRDQADTYDVGRYISPKSFLFTNILL